MFCHPIFFFPPAPCCAVYEYTTTSSVQTVHHFLCSFSRLAVHSACDYSLQDGVISTCCQQKLMIDVLGFSSKKEQKETDSFLRVSPLSFSHDSDMWRYTFILICEFYLWMFSTAEFCCPVTLSMRVAIRGQVMLSRNAPAVVVCAGLLACCSVCVWPPLPAFIPPSPELIGNSSMFLAWLSVWKTGQLFCWACLPSQQF